MDIANFVYHGVEKEQGKDSKITDLFESSELIAIKRDDIKLLTFLDKLRGKYNKAGPSYGQLKKDEDSNFTKYLNKYLSSEIDFLIFSQKVFGLISTEIEGTATATGGIILFLEYKQLDKEYILIVVLKEKDVMTLNKSNKSLEFILSLDVEKLHEAARISINDFLDDKQPYLSFIKKSSNKKVTDYFRKALNCEDFTDSDKFTDNLLNLYRKFARSKTYDREQMQKDEKKIFDLFEQIRIDKRDGKGDGLVKLSTISTILNVSNEDEFLNYIQSDELNIIPHDFEPSKSIYSRLQRFKGKDGDTSFSFSRADYNSGKVNIEILRNDSGIGAIVTFRVKNAKTLSELKEFRVLE